MRRTLLAVSLCLAVATTATAQDAPRAQPRVVLAACASGPSPDERFAVVTGSAAALTGTRRMAMQFGLQERRTDDARWTRLRARGFGRWLRSDAGRSRFIYTKRIERLEQAASYRMTVRFRWYRADGSVQRTVTRRSPVCRQPDQRPDLRVESLTVLAGPGAPSQRYVVSVVNEGRTAAGPFVVGLVAAGDHTRQVAGLPAGERAQVGIVAPRCPTGDTVAVTLDVRGVVDESDEADNRFSRPCSGR